MIASRLLAGLAFHLGDSSRIELAIRSISLNGGAGRLEPYQHAFWVAAGVATVGVCAAWFVRSTPRGASDLA